MRMPNLASRLNSEWRQKTDRVNQRLSEFYRVFKRKQYPSSEDLFFALEDLPSMGKEYWFLYFCAPPREEQVVITLGRSVEPVKVNETRVRTDDEGGSVPCAAVCWYYSGKKHVVFDSIADVSIGKCGAKKSSRSLCAANGKSRISMSGSYPDYSIELVSSGKKVFSAQASLPKKGMPFEMVHMLENPLVPRFGAVMINYYFDFKGELCGKKLSGKAYLQKVVAVLPLAPWNWVRLYFSKGAALDFFTGKPFGPKSDLRFACNDYLEISGKRIRLPGISISSYLSGEKRIWVLSGKNFYCAMETYSLQPFIMKQKTTFRYDEYLVKVRALAFQDGTRQYTLDELGEGVGLVEDAKGYLI